MTCRAISAMARVIVCCNQILAYPASPFYANISVQHTQPTRFISLSDTAVADVGLSDELIGLEGFSLIFRNCICKVSK